MKQKLFTFFLALVASASTIYASDTAVDGIWYDFDSSTKTASVTYQGSSSGSYSKEYAGSVTIPETVIYNGTTYSVTSIGYGAFSNCSGLTSVTIPTSVTSIGGSAFMYCSSLTSVTIPNSVTSIGGEAFKGCSGLTSVTIPNSVTSIGNSAFSSCSGLLSVTIPNSVTSIGNSAFSGCSSLTSVTIPTSVTSIGSGAFSSCSGLPSVTIPNSVTSIGNSAFSGCSSLTSVVWNAENCADMSAGDYYPFGEKNSQITSFTFGDKVQHIPSNLCYNMRNLTSITIPNSVTSIGISAFMYCSSLTSVTIGNGVTSIGNATFMYCSSLTSITIPNSVTSIGFNAFSNCSGLTSVTIGNGVTYIGYNAFYKCSSLTSVTIGESVTSIGENAFSECSSLTSVVWNAENCADLSGIYLDSSDYPFYKSFQITSLTFGDKVRYIPRSMFMNQKNLTSITIPNSVTSIGDYAFYSCSGLTSVTIGNSVTSIGKRAFMYCSGLTSVTIGNSVTSIGNDAFFSCSSLTSITIPNSVTSIGDDAFSRCSGLTSVTIGNSVTSIGDNAFWGCSSLTSITIPNSVTSIGSDAFYCNSLTSIYWNAIKCSDCSFSSSPFGIKSPNISLYIGDEVEYIPNYLFYELGNVTSLTLPKTLKSIGSSAFYYCAIQGKIDYKGDLGDWCKIKFQDNPMKYSSEGTTLYINNKEIKDNIILPNSVDSIPSSAFYNCKKISSVKIPKDVKYIGSSAFGNCEKLYDIYCYAQEPPAADETSFANYNVNLYVPCESLKDYQMNPVFGSFKYIQCLDEEEIVEETELPVVSLYDWLLMLNINAINEMGYYFSQSDVNWYRVVGEPDDIHTDFPSDDQLVVEGSYYLTLENSLKGTGNYYAVVDVHQKQDMSGDSFMRSEIISYSTAKQPAKLALLPGVVANGQPLQLIGLNPEETTNIYVYNATGQLINQVTSTGNTTLNLDAASLAGYYQVVVQSLSTTETLRYIVK